MPKDVPRSFTWVPDKGPDPKALRRMAEVFARPKTPMGEDWFIGKKRQMYPELSGDLEHLAEGQLTRPLEAIASGTSCFGPLEEWVEWYHYLLPRLLKRHWKPPLSHPVELLVTGFVTQHPDSKGNLPYAHFRADALATLGQYIMSHDFWQVSDAEVPGFFNKWAGPTGIRGWDIVDGLLSGSLFFCIKYLPADSVGPWFKSVIAIPNIYWRAQVITWLVGAHPILTNQIGQPAQFSEDLHFSVDWDWSHTLDGNYSGDHDSSEEVIPFLPTEGRETILEVVRDINKEALLDVFNDPHLGAVLAEAPDLPGRFIEIYGSGGLMG